MRAVELRHRALAAVCLATLALAPLVSPARADGPEVWAITGVRIVPVSGPPIERGTVVIRDGIVESVGASVSAPADARVVEGAGLVVYPGLVDAYAPVEAESRPTTGPPVLDRERPQGFFPQRLALDMIRPGGRAESLRAVGITSQLVVPRDGVITGQGALVNLAGATVDSMAVRSPAALHFTFESQGGFYDYPGSIMGTFAVIRQKLIDARRYEQEWARYRRSARGFPRPEMNRDLEALLPALGRQVPVIFPTTSEAEVRRVVRLAAEFNLRAIVAGGIEAWKAADALKAADIPVLVALAYPERERGVDAATDEPLRVLRVRDEAPSNAARLRRAGVRIAFEGAGLKTPRDFVANAAKAVAAGLSEDEALRALTLAPAEIYGVSEQLGSIERGKIANLVVTDGSLFAKGTKVRYVFVDGRRFTIDDGQAPASAPTVDVTGTWSFTIDNPKGKLSPTIELRQSGTSLAGTFTETSLGTADFHAGVVSGNQVSFTVSVPQGGTMTEIAFSGTVTGDKIEGTATVPSAGTVPFSGTRPKAR